MKITTYIALVILGIALVLFAFKECDSKPSNRQEKSNSSIIVDQIKTRQAEIINAKLDSVVFIYKDSISKLTTKDKALTKEYNRLRSIVKHLQPVRVDSFNQVVNNIPVDVYNAEIEAGNVCDQLLGYKDVQISIRDSIIANHEEKIVILDELIETKDQALQDIILLDEEKETNLKRAKSLNKKIPLIGALCAGVGAFLVLFALK